MASGTPLCAGCHRLGPVRLEMSRGWFSSRTT